MLIQKKKTLDKGEVVVVKLVSGTEIVARLSNDYRPSLEVVGSGAVTFIKPLVAQAVRQQGGIGLEFLPFSLSARDDEEFTFTEDKLMLAPFAARDEVKNSYLESTTSLALPPSGLKL